jgi:hypothetical protein
MTGPAGPAPPPGERFDSVLHRMYRREAVGTLPTHLGHSCGITVTKLTPLDVGVFRVDRAPREVPLVARLFSAARSASK